VAKKERRSKKNRSISTKNGQQKQQSSSKQEVIQKQKSYGNFSSFDNRSSNLVSNHYKSPVIDYKNQYVYYKSPNREKDKERLSTSPVLLSHGMFDKCYEQSQITMKEMNQMGEMVSPTNIKLPVIINQAGAGGDKS
jgi:hypothetical protein